MTAYPPHVESQEDAPHPDARWNPQAWKGLGRWETPDGTPVAVPQEVVAAVAWLSSGGQPDVGQACALADRVAQLEAELVKVMGPRPERFEGLTTADWLRLLR